jgi:hypothetical protein
MRSRLAAGWKRGLAWAAAGGSTALCVLCLGTSPARAEVRNPERPLSTSSDQQRRRQAAGELRVQGFDVDWRLASWDELHDWTLRAAEARLLRERFGVIVDWRPYALAEMRDWEGRIARAVDLRRFGVDADWRLYSGRQLDDLRAFLEHARAEAPSSTPRAQDLVPPEVTMGFDPDAILVPTYVTEELTRGETDDAILEPSFSRRARKPQRDALPTGGSTKPPATPLAPAPTPPPARTLKPAPPAAPAVPAPPAPPADIEPARL